MSRFGRYVCSDLGVPVAVVMPGGGSPVVPPPPPDPDPVPDPADVPTLVPGAGFVGSTAQPADVGGSDVNTMARYDVVPYQVIPGEFEIGVVAFHREALAGDGIDRVEFSFNDGPWVAIDTPSLNPRTNVVEYWCKINAADIADGRHKVRAIAYPEQGRPRVLESLVVQCNANGTNGEVVTELQAGHYAVTDVLSTPYDKWHILRPAAGVNKADVNVYGISSNNTGNVKLEGITVRGGAGKRFPGNGGRLWMDDVDYTTGVPANSGEVAWCMADENWAAKYFTNGTCTRFQAPFWAGEGIIRNWVADVVYEDLIRQRGLIVNVTANTIAAFDGGYHPDVFQWYNVNPTNMIVNGLTANNAAAQGLFPGDLTDCAFVNVDLMTIGNYRPLQMQGNTTNVLIQDSNLLSDSLGGVLRNDLGFVANGLTFRDTNVGVAAPYTPPGLGWAGITHVENGVVQ